MRHLVADPVTPAPRVVSDVVEDEAFASGRDQRSGRKDAVTCAVVPRIGQAGHGLQERPQHRHDILAGGARSRDPGRVWGANTGARGARLRTVAERMQSPCARRRRSDAVLAGHREAPPAGFEPAHTAPETMSGAGAANL